MCKAMRIIASNQAGCRFESRKLEVENKRADTKGRANNSHLFDQHFLAVYDIEAGTETITKVLEGGL